MGKTIEKPESALVAPTIIQNREPLFPIVAQANRLFMKQYMSELSHCNLEPFNDALIDGDISDYSRLYKITRISYDGEEDNLLKLSNVYHAVACTKGSLFVVIDSDGEEISFSVGIRAFDRNDLLIAEKTLIKTLQGNFPGFESCRLTNNQEKLFLQRLFSNREESTDEEHRVISAVSGISSLRKIDESKIKKAFTQGIEKLIDSMRGEIFSVLIIADPITPERALEMKRDYSTVYDLLKPYEDAVVSVTGTKSESITDTIGHTTAETLSNSVTRSTSSSYSKTKTGTINVGVPIGPVNVGASYSSSVTEGVSSSVANTKGKAGTTGKNESHANGKSVGYSEGIQIHKEKREVREILDKIDAELERFNDNGDIGLWNCATYILTDDIQTSKAAAMGYYALMKGEKSGLEHTAINTWAYNSDSDSYETENNNFAELENYLKHLMHPIFRLTNSANDPTTVSPATVLTTDELTVHAGFPQKSVPGITVAEHAAFGRNIVDNRPGASKISLGRFYHMGREEGKHAVELELNSMTSHVFVTGSTGRGKSNAVYKLLEQTVKANKKVHFMVVEPAKGEYKKAFNEYPGIPVKVYGTNHLKTELIRINPFSFPNDIHVLEHIDSLIEIMNVCWPLYAAMPAILKNAVLRSYVQCGWDIVNSKCRYDEVLYPTFYDVLSNIRSILDSSDYSSDNKGDYTGALCTRVESLTNGINGQIFTSSELRAEELFEQNVIVDLSRLKATETSALIMGILVMKLQEYRTAQNSGSNRELNHITVLEEAHNLLKKTSTEQSADSANIAGKSVEMLSNAIAEMRTYGEGFVIVDQAPGLLDISVIRNTNTKIVLGLPEAGDREIVGKSMALNDNQVSELAKLEVGVAAVYQNSWEEAVLCKCDVFKNENENREMTYHGCEIKTSSELKKEVVKYLLDCSAEVSTENPEIFKVVSDLPVASVLRREIKQVIVENCKDENRIIALISEIYDLRKALMASRHCENEEKWQFCLLQSMDPELIRMDKKYINQLCNMICRAARNNCI